MAESHCRGSWVDMGMDDPSFPELTSSDQHAATLPFLMPLAGTVSAQDHLAVPGSKDQQILGEGRDLRRVGSPTSCSKSLVLHVTGYPWPFHVSKRKLGCVSPAPSQWPPNQARHKGMAST